MKVIGLAIREKPRSPMQLIEHAVVSEAAGVELDFRGKFKQRQVTLLSHEQWQLACQELDVELPWTFRRANVLVENITFSPKDLGKFLVNGDLILQVTEETEPCERMDQQHNGLRSALNSDWRGGICCTVIQSGQIRLGDEIKLVREI